VTITNEALPPGEYVGILTPVEQLPQSDLIKLNFTSSGDMDDINVSNGTAYCLSVYRKKSLELVTNIYILPDVTTGKASMLGLAIIEFTAVIALQLGSDPTETIIPIIAVTVIFLFIVVIVIVVVVCAVQKNRVQPEIGNDPVDGLKTVDGQSQDGRGTEESTM
jgi:hypothetical protein